MERSNSQFVLNISRKFSRPQLIVFAVVVLSLQFFNLGTSLAATQTLNNPAPTTVNISDPGFRLLICDGPVLPSNVPEPTNLGHKYVPCDFNGLMLQVQHLINIAMVAGVIVAIGGFSYAGYLFITGTPANIGRAKEIFPKIGLGFVIMLSAWFIVYQLLAWLTGNNGFGALLGNP